MKNLIEYMQTMFKELYQGRNLSIHALVILSLILLIVGQLGFELSNYIIHITIFSIIVFAVALLKLLHLTYKISSSLKKTDTTSVVLCEEYPKKRINKAVESSLDSIRFMQTYLPGAMPISFEVFEAAKRGVSVKLLLIDPFCNAAIERKKALGQDLESCSDRMLNSLENVLRLIYENDLEGNIEIKFSRLQLPFSMYAIDDLYVLGFYWPKLENMAASHVLYSKDPSKFSKQVEDSFAELWKKAVYLDSLAPEITEMAKQLQEASLASNSED